MEHHTAYILKQILNTRRSRKTFRQKEVELKANIKEGFHKSFD